MQASRREGGRIRVDEILVKEWNIREDRGRRESSGQYERVDKNVGQMT